MTSTRASGVRRAACEEGSAIFDCGAQGERHGLRGAGSRRQRVRPDLKSYGEVRESVEASAGESADQLFEPRKDMLSECRRCRYGGRQSRPNDIELAQALVDSLHQTATGTNPPAFERAVCDAFAGVRRDARRRQRGARRLHRRAAGPAGLSRDDRMQDSDGVVTQPYAVEASKYRDPYRAVRGADRSGVRRATK